LGSGPDHPDKELTMTLGGWAAEQEWERLHPAESFDSRPLSTLADYGEALYWAGKKGCTIDLDEGLLRAQGIVRECWGSISSSAERLFGRTGFGEHKATARH
jgi:hypothetical protein